ncbi:MAG TPA: hypothetical protein VGF87_05480 [Acidimicrobiales bacterium]|jgi:hypothetical protein
MSLRKKAMRGGRMRGKVFALAAAAATVLPGAFVVLTPTGAGAAPTNPLGPTIAQLQAEYALLLVNVESTLTNLEDIAIYGNPAVILLEQLSCSLKNPERGACLQS